MEIYAPAFTRRRFLRDLGQGMLLASLPSPLWAADYGAVTISILHTTDLHGHILPTTDYSGHPDLGGLARCATQIRQWQRANPHSILLDVGDVYQGTELGLHSFGNTMIRCLNALKYDAWVIGNHEFDWGLNALSQCVLASSMPVLSGNALYEGKPFSDIKANPQMKSRPYLIKEVSGIRIAIIGLTTPALTSWLPPENLRGFEVLDPVESLGQNLREVSALKPDAILIAGHMGLKRRDDYANRVGALTAAYPNLVAYLGGHTHQNQPSEIINNVLYTQADHYGIYAGKVDLTFDAASKKLLHREAVTVLMDNKIALDPVVLSISKPELDASDQILAQKIGELTETFNVTTAVGQPSDVERLIASAIIAALRKRDGTEVDVVVHGLFDTKAPLEAGSKTVADAWTILPYENEIVTVDLSRSDLFSLARGLSTGPETRSLMGFRVAGSKVGAKFQVDDLHANDGTPLPPKPFYRVALNSYDSQSGGQRFPVVARLVAQKSNHRILHSVETRGALIDFFVTRKKVSRKSLLV